MPVAFITTNQKHAAVSALPAEAFQHLKFTVKPDQTETLRELLTKDNKEFTFHEYEGAGHAFFAVDRPSYRPEVATEAWGEIWKFYGQYLSSAK